MKRVAKRVAAGIGAVWRFVGGKPSAGLEPATLPYHGHLMSTD
jgi:hypothetical protein